MARVKEPSFVSQLMDLGAQYTEDATDVANVMWDNTEEDRQQVIKMIADSIPTKKYKDKFIKEAEAYGLD